MNSCFVNVGKRDSVDNKQHHFDQPDCVWYTIKWRTDHAICSVQQEAKS